MRPVLILKHRVKSKPRHFDVLQLPRSKIFELLLFDVFEALRTFQRKIKSHNDKTDLQTYLNFYGRFKIMI